MNRFERLELTRSGGSNFVVPFLMRGTSADGNSIALVHAASILDRQTPRSLTDIANEAREIVAGSRISTLREWEEIASAITISPEETTISSVETRFSVGTELSIEFLDAWTSLLLRDIPVSQERPAVSAPAETRTELRRLRVRFRVQLEYRLADRSHTSDRDAAMVDPPPATADARSAARAVAERLLRLPLARPGPTDSGAA